MELALGLFFILRIHCLWDAVRNFLGRFMNMAMLNKTGGLRSGVSSRYDDFYMCDK
jgi:hypothetical protein